MKNLFVLCLSLLCFTCKPYTAEERPLLLYRFFDDIPNECEQASALLWNMLVAANNNPDYYKMGNIERFNQAIAVAAQNPNISDDALASATAWSAERTKYLNTRKTQWLLTRLQEIWNKRYPDKK